MGRLYSATSARPITHWRDAEGAGEVNEALPLRRAVGDRNGEALTLNNIGAVYNSLGEMRKALEKFNEALPILRAIGDRSLEATTLNNIGVAYDSLGEMQKALEAHNEALPIRRAVGDRSGRLSHSITSARSIGHWEK